MDLQRNVVSDTTRVMQNFLALRDIHIIPLRLSRTEDLVSKICCCKMSTFGRPSPSPLSRFVAPQIWTTVRRILPISCIRPPINLHSSHLLSVTKPEKQLRPLIHHLDLWSAERERRVDILHCGGGHFSEGFF